MAKCKNCGKPIEEGKEYCPVCERGTPLTEKFNVLHDIDRFDVFEENKFEAKQKRKKRKKRLICICITVAVLIVALVGIKWAMNKSASYDETVLESAHVAHTAQETEKPAENKPAEEETIVVEEESVEGGNDINKLKERVMKFCNRYNNGQSLYEGDLIATVPNRKTISATYHIPKVLSVEERDAVKEYEEELKNVILEEMKDDFPEEITVNVKTIVSYR